MIASRILALFCLSILWLAPLSGQQPDATAPEVLPAELKALVLEPMETDSAGAILQIPNVFSPNGDQVNDFFEVTTDGTTVYEFSVFTRSGTRIYHSYSPRISWDGKSLDGIDLAEGIYYYIIEEEGGSNPFEKAGFMYLYR